MLTHKKACERRGTRDFRFAQLTAASSRPGPGLARCAAPLEVIDTPIRRDMLRERNLRTSPPSSGTRAWLRGSPRSHKHASRRCARTDELLTVTPFADNHADEHFVRFHKTHKNSPQLDHGEESQASVRPGVAAPQEGEEVRCRVATRLSSSASSRRRT